MDSATLAILLMILAAFAFYGFRLARGDNDDADSEVDTGSAILDFARAFPGEAIRSLHMTVDHEAVFVRLHDNRAGFMRNMGNHYTCLLLEPTSLHVEPLPTEDGLVVTFHNAPNLSGEYRFNTREEAADVSLWLMASLQVETESDSSSDLEGQENAEENSLQAETAEGVAPEENDPLAAFTSGPVENDRR